jgi:precorrin-6B methylase 1
MGASEVRTEEASINSDADLYLVGAGIAFPDHLTLQTIEILSRCEEVYTNLPDNQLHALPPDLRAKCVSLWSLYRDKRDRRENYSDVVEAIIGRAMSVRPFGWMTPGHPLVFDSVSQALMKAGEQRGWQVQVVPGISSLDTILAEVGYDPAHGLIVYEAHALVKDNVPILADLAALLLQPGAFGSDLAQLSGLWRPDLVPLREYICRFHPSGHECAFVWSSHGGGGRHKIWWCKAAELESIPEEALGNSTLFIPPAGFSFSKFAR